MEAAMETRLELICSEAEATVLDFVEILPVPSDILDDKSDRSFDDTPRVLCSGQITDNALQFSYKCIKPFGKLAHLILMDMFSLLVRSPSPLLCRANLLLPLNWLVMPLPIIKAIKIPINTPVTIIIKNETMVFLYVAAASRLASSAISDDVCKFINKISHILKLFHCRPQGITNGLSFSLACIRPAALHNLLRKNKPFISSGIIFGYKLFFLICRGKPFVIFQRSSDCCIFSS
jgi:hypothetical protein